MENEKEEIKEEKKKSIKKKVQTKEKVSKIEEVKKENSVKEESKPKTRRKKVVKEEPQVIEEAFIEEQEKEEKALLEVKNQEASMEIPPEKLEEIGKVIEKQKIVPKIHQKKMMQRVFDNLILAIVFLLYFFFINLGAMHIGQETFLVDLYVFCLFTLAISIYLFEVAYKKDKGRIAIHGIEVLAMAIITLLSLYLFQMQKDQFPLLLNAASLIFSVYFVGKSIYLYVKMKKRALKQNNDVHRIAKTKE